MLRWKRTALVVIAAGALTPSAALAQAAGQTDRDPNVATETQERRAEGQDNDTNWDWLGLLGLAGLAGLLARKRDDSGRRHTDH